MWYIFHFLKEASQDFSENTFHFRISLIIIGIKQVFYFFTWIIITFQLLTQMEELMLFGISFAFYTMYGIGDNLEDNKSVSGRTVFGDRSIFMVYGVFEHFGNGVVDQRKEVPR